MSKVMTSTQWTDLLDKWGIRHIAIHSDWAKHNRNAKGEFGDMHGIVIHHTGSHGATADQCDILWNGYGALPGPLCHAGIDINGIARLAGWGRANHAGLGDSAILDHVIREDYGLNKTLHPTKADKDGNSVFYGFEIMCDGNIPMSDAQRKSIVRICAAICTHHNWGPESVIGHGEWQPGKWDPGAHGKLIDMGAFRREVDQAIKEGPKKVQPPTPSNVYTVKSGDTLTSIAKYKLGDAHRWPDLVSANPSVIHLPVGTKLTLPGK